MKGGGKKLSDRIRMLKKRARGHYRLYYANHANCGLSLLEYISAQTLQAKMAEGKGQG